MLRGLTTVLMGLLAISTVIDGNTKESINLRICNSDFLRTNAEMLKMMKKADLEGHGFKKEESRTMLSSTNNSAYITNLYYFKVVDCSQVVQVLMEVEKLLPGTLGTSVDARLVKEIKDKKIETMKKCKAGVEIHLQPDTGYVHRFTLSRFKRDAGCDGCSKCCCKCCCCGKVEAEE